MISMAIFNSYVKLPEGMIYHESNLAGSDPLRFRVQRYSDRASIFRGAVAANRKGMGKYQYFKGHEFVGIFLLTRLDDTR